MISQSQISDAKKAIVNQFSEQCTHGSQTAGLQNEEYAACGQFIDKNARSLSQRGLHGTAAALFVLGAAQNHELCRKLVLFLTRRSEIESDNTRISDDESNVIKQAELLLALSQLPASHQTASELKGEIVARLLTGKIEDKSWPYFLGDDDPSPLATAYAVLALSAAGEDVTKAVDYLLDASGEGNDTTHADLAINVTCLYAIVFHKRASADDSERSKTLKIRFDAYWKSLEGLMSAGGVEQNIEYWKGTKTFYVRVPWQLYLLALSAELRYYRRFLTKAAQCRFDEVVRDSNDNRFIYPHSGSMVSARTNAIAFDVLNRIQRIKKNRFFEDALIAIDSARNSRWLRLIIGIGALIVVGFAVARWWGSDDSDIADLAPEFIAAVLTGLALWAKRK